MHSSIRRAPAPTHNIPMVLWMRCIDNFLDLGEANGTLCFDLTMKRCDCPQGYQCHSWSWVRNVCPELFFGSTFCNRNINEWSHLTSSKLPLGMNIQSVNGWSIVCQGDLEYSISFHCRAVLELSCNSVELVLGSSDWFSFEESSNTQYLDH